MFEVVVFFNVYCNNNYLIFLSLLLRGGEQMDESGIQKIDRILLVLKLVRYQQLHLIE